MKYITLWVSAVLVFYVVVNISPALALLSSAFLVTCPMLKLSLEIARTEDKRALN